MTTTHTVAERPGAPSEGLLARHPLIFFFLLAYTGGSVLMAILLHTAIDVAFAFAVLFPSTKTDLSPSSFGTLGIAIVFSIAALVIIIATRGQLSYQREVELPAGSGTVR